jgi:hypothetical protein
MFTSGIRSCGTLPYLLLTLTGLIIQCLAAQTLQKNEASTDTQHHDDLRILAAPVAHYEIYGATPEEAILQLWKQVLGREPTIPIMIPPATTERRVVTMDVSDNPGSQILEYIAQLSGCHWSLRGWDANGLRLEFTPIKETDDTGLMLYGDALELNEEGRNTFGLTSKITPDQLMAILESYGLNFGEAERRGVTSYRPEDQTLVVVVPKDQLNLARTLINLANKGKLKAYSGR